MEILYLYYNQPKAIQNLESIGYPFTRFNFHFVDDGSKEPLKCEWAKVYRIQKDIAWNQPAANNYGFSKLDPEAYVLRLDIDHYFNIEDLDAIDKIELKPKQIVYFRRKLNGGEIASHPNCYLARVKDLIDIGGYNEEFCGNYGFDDSELRHRMKFNRFKLLFSKIYLHAVLELRTEGLKRDTKINHTKFKRIVKEMYLHSNYR